MKKPMIRRLAAILLTLAPLWASGCGGASQENLSVKGETDSAKLKQAQAEIDAADAKSKAIEAAVTKGRIKPE